MNTRALAAASLAAAGLLATGCADNNASVQIGAICAPPDDAAACGFSSTCDAQYIGLVEVDVAATDRLWLEVQVNNQLTNNADPATGRGNTHDAHIREYVTTYETPGFPARLPTTMDLVGPFAVPAAGSAVVSLFPINPQSAATLALNWPASLAEQLVIAKVRARGVYDDQTEFETAEYVVHVRVCNGCFTVPDCDPETLAIEPPIAFCPNFGQSPASVACPN